MNALSGIPEAVWAGFEGEGRSGRLFQIRGCSKGCGDGRAPVMRDDLWFSGLTEVKRNVGHDGISPERSFRYLCE